MAELIAGAFLSSVIQVTLEKLASIDIRGFFHKGLAEKLEIILNSIYQLLDDAETKQYQNIYVKNWLDKLKHEVYEVEQLLDEIATYAQLKGKVQLFFSGFTNNVFQSRIKDLLDKLKLLIEQKDALGLNQRNSIISSEFSLQLSKRSPTASLVDESCIYGRDDDKNKIIKYLLSDNNNDNDNGVSIISIVGLGGMGKTTLAQLVYNDQRIEKQFELKAWVHVPESFEIVGLTKTILRSFHSSADYEDLDPVLCKLKQTLTNKKYLLVLDDVWNGSNEGCWEQLLLPLNHGSSGSKVIVTTRNTEVALVMKSEQQFHLKQLSESDSWGLFVNHAFQRTNVFEYPNLEMIGKKIVEKCGGLPLAIKTLGNLLRRKFSQSEWVKVLETDLFLLSNDDSSINPTLRLSYHCLSSNLKRCFVYCSIFPKGYEFEKGELIELWRAEGLLKCCTTEKSEEQEVGNQFFNDLQSISFFQQSTSFGKFVLHDLVSDLAKSMSGEFSFVIKGDRVQNIPKRTRHIWCSFGLKHHDGNLDNIYKIKGLRSLALQTRLYARQQFKHDICQNVQHDLFSRLIYLRMLSFFGCNLSKLADEISNLKLLRYLDLSYTGVTKLPDSICMLYNLETLLLKHCNLTELPTNFSKLINLCHLNLEGNYITKVPKHIGRLQHLQTLTTLDFVVEKKKGHDIKEVAKLNHLQGTLCISCLENVIDPANAAEANLKDKKHLEELCMKYSTSQDRRVNYEATLLKFDVDVLEALQPNNNLKRLTIEEYTGNRFPNWIRSCDLPNLVSIKLQHCKSCSQLPPLGQLPSLKELNISGCDGIEFIGEEFYGNNSSNVPFRSLETLRFEWMPKWEEWLFLEGFPLLKELSIRGCPNLKRALPQHLPSLQKLEIIDCKVLEASIPKASNISELNLKGCDIILINELPSTLKKLVLCENRFTKVSLDQHLFNSSILEVLDLDFSGFVIYPYFELRCYNSLRTLSLKGWRSSYLPFELHLFTDLDSLKLSHCPKLKSFRGRGLPSNLSWLEIINCPKLIAEREKLGLCKLNYLQEFKVSDENVESFPEKDLLPRTIHIVHLYKCPKLRIMNGDGFLAARSLQSIYIQSCPLLECLPEGLPMNSFLGIYDCPLLKDKYQKEDGEHWHTISHINAVEIDGVNQKLL